MSESVLGSVVNDLVESSEKSEFIDRVHEETKIPKETLSEQYDHGLEAAKQSRVSQNPIPWAKYYVYRFVRKN